jgi:4-amino-4-deoxy-L-arabinose transferase-like glycosyltransferase
MPGKRFLWTCLLCICVWLSFLPVRGVWAPDEARYAQVASEMKEQNRWLIPSLNEHLYTQKPPLFFDLVRLSAAFSEGVPEWAVKVPSLLAGLLALAMVSLIGVRLMGPNGAWMPPLILGTMFKFGWQAQFGQIDMVIVGLVAAQIALGLRLASGSGRRWVGLLGMMVLGFAGVLSKGPVGCLLPWLILFAYLAIKRDWPGLRRTGLHWIVPGVALLSLAWLGLALVVQGEAYIRALVLKQSVERYINPWHHKAPFYYYLGIFWTDGLPYSLLLVPMALPLARKKTWKEPGALLPLVWMGVYLVFFSLSAGKRSVYVLPLFPAMALLLAYGLLNIDMERWRPEGLRRAIFLVAAMFLVAIAPLILKAPAGFRSLVPWVAVGLALLAVSFIWAGVLAGNGKIFKSLVAMVLGSVLFLMVGALPVVAALDAVKTPRTLAAAVKPSLDRGALLAVYPSLIPSLNYYAGTRTQVFSAGEEEAAVAFLRGGAGRLLLVDQGVWKVGVPDGCSRAGTFTIGDDHYLLLSGQGG